jgi:large repetitive protein
MTSVIRIATLAICLLACAVTPTSAQSVLDPNDPIVNYNSSNPPTQPPFGQIGKWVRTPRLGWNTTQYKCYIYKGVAFRLLYPRTYNPTANDGKKYPMMVFFHGLGEAGPITDNEFQLYHGADYFRTSQNNNRYDGYVLFLQSQGFWGGGHYDYVKEIIDYMVPNNKLDAFRVSVNGLSAGGTACWEMALKYPTYVSAVLPMSGVHFYYQDPATVNLLKYTPIWNIHGRRDASPAPSTAFQVRDAFLAAGGNYKNTEYADLGHDTWNRTWNEPDFWGFTMIRPHAANPWPLFGRTEFCPTETLNVTLGMVPGMDEYQWRKDGVLISGATSNTLVVTQLGTYSARIRRGTVWSDWSPAPVQIKIKAATVTPPIQVSNGASRVLPGVNGTTSLQLEVPDGYTSYDWQREGQGTTISTTRFLNVTTLGQYKVRVTEQFGCSSSFSPLLTVIDANGTPKPDAPTNLLATTLSQTSVRLDWNENPSPVLNESNFEVYQSTTPGGVMTLAGVTNANIKTLTLTNLTPNTNYHFKVRAIANTGVSAFTNEANAQTLSDVIAPTTPVNLKVTDVTSTSVALSWGASTDNVGVSKYELYINGVRSYITTQTQFLVPNLTTNTNYIFRVRALDQSGNASPFSNQVAVKPSFGLNYKYYTYTGSLGLLPDFNNLPASQPGATITLRTTSKMQNVALTPRTQNDNFAFLWEGFIKIPVTGVYYFRTRSDDGSKLYLGLLNGTTSPYNHTATPMVANDGLHAPQDATSAPVTLTAGIYPIAITFYEQGGGEEMIVSWNTPETNNTFVPIPNMYFVDQFPGALATPAKPSNLVANAVSATQINLSWTDNSTNETGFEIWRSTNAFSGFAVIGLTAANATTYNDAGLSPNIRYYYKIRAVNANGESAFDLAGQGVDYSYYETSMSNLPSPATVNGMTPKKSGRWNNFTLGLQDRSDNFMFKFSTWIDIPTTGVYRFFLNSDDGSKLYIDGFADANLVVNNDGAHGPVEVSNTINLTKGPHEIHVLYFEGGAGESLSVSMSGPGMTKQVIPDALLGTPHANAFTTATTPAPSMPSSVVASGTSSTSVNITWQDNSNNETGFEIQRSVDNGVTYVPLTVTAANATSYADNGLFANAVYYYRVRANGAVNNSAFATRDSAKTRNIVPVITQIANRSARFGITTNVTIRATDADGDNLSFTGQNLPTFATLINNGDRTATLILNPSSAQQGVYNNLRINVSDPNGGSDFTQFNLTVNDNYDPVITAIPAQSTNENQLLSLTLSASDQNAGEALTWSVSGLPNNYTLTPGTNGNAILAITPTYASAGVYNVTVNISDPRGGSDSKQFTLTVNDKDPNLKVFMRIQGEAVPAVGLPWNSISNQFSSNLKNSFGETTSIGLNFTSGYNVGDQGAVTGNNSGIYPDAVLKTYFMFGAFGWMPQTGVAVITGLNPGQTYNITLLGSSVWNITTDNGNTDYTINGVKKSLYVQNNTQNTVSFNNVTPAADGTITITMTKGTGATAGYLNSLVLDFRYQDGTAPQAPSNLSASYLPGQGVKLNWRDNAYNETGFEIYRATSLAGPYTLIGTLSIPDSSGYTDAGATGNSLFFYYVRAINTFGNSANSNTVTITTPNRVPQVAAIANVNIKTNQTATVNISVADDPTAVLTINAAGLPSFASFTDNGNGTATISIQPNAGSAGSYRNVTITAKDQFGASSTATFDINITDQFLTSVYFNFTSAQFIAPKPWNNLVNPQSVGTTYSGLKDDSDQASPISLNIQDGWEWISGTGIRVSNGREIYPESVSRISLIESGTGIKRLLISGLNTSRRYNFVFFSSRDDGRTSNTQFKIGSEIVQLNASYNSNRTVQINGVTPNGSGQVTIEVSKVAGFDYALLNAMIVQEYNPATAGILAPSGLQAVQVGRNAVTLMWQDRTSNETGFEIFRVAQGGASYTSLATVGSNVTTYTDNTVSPNTTYHYVVKARVNASSSPSSNVVKATTLVYKVYINFNRDLVAPSPWNNTTAIPAAGLVYNNLKEETGAGTSLGLTTVTSFSGLYGGGVNTTNNSGIYPDNVMVESYGNFPGISSTVKITGLNLGMKYNFTFFGSSNDTRNIYGVYTVNGKTGYLNASLNKFSGVTLYDVVADENGEAVITIAADAGSEFGLLGALIVDAYVENSTTAPTAPARINTELVDIAPADAEPGRSLVLFPNPFSNEFSLSIPSEDGRRVDIRMFDVTGRLVHQQTVANLVKGNNTVRVQPSSLLRRGIYQVVVSDADRKTLKTFKAVRQ